MTSLTPQHRSTEHEAGRERKRGPGGRGGGGRQAGGRIRPRAALAGEHKARGHSALRLSSYSYPWPQQNVTSPRSAHPPPPPPPEGCAHTATMWASTDPFPLLAAARRQPWLLASLPVHGVLVGTLWDTADTWRQGGCVKSIPCPTLQRMHMARSTLPIHCDAEKAARPVRWNLFRRRSAVIAARSPDSLAPNQHGWRLVDLPSKFNSTLPPTDQLDSHVWTEWLQVCAPATSTSILHFSCRKHLGRGSYWKPWCNWLLLHVSWSLRSNLMKFMYVNVMG